MRKLLLGALVTGVTTLTTHAAAQELRFMTGPQGGVWVPIGGQLKDLWEKAIPGLKVQPLPGAGIANVRGLEEDKTDVGFGNSVSTADAIVGNPPFDKKHGKVCNLASLYPQYLQIVTLAGSGITSLKDMKGKTLSTQPRGNTAEQLAQLYLKANGLAPGDVKIAYGSYTDGIEQMKDGHAQMFIGGATIPLGAIMDLASARDIALLDISDSIEAMKKLNPALRTAKVPAGTYPKQAREVTMISYTTHLAVKCGLPEASVYTMVKTISENAKTLGSINRDIEKMTVEVMAQDIGVPFHAGARKFFTEKGIKMN